MEEEFNAEQTPIPAEEIQPTEQVAVPKAPDSQAGEMASQISSEAQTITAEQERVRAEEEARKAREETQESRKQLMERVGDVEEVMTARPQLERELGIPGLREETAELTSQIEARELSMRRQIERTQKEVGLTASQVDARVREIQRKGASELADLSVVLNAKSRRMEALQTSVDRRINLELEPLELRMQFDRLFYEENKQTLTQAQDRAFKLRLQETEREYNEQLQNKQAVGEIMKQAALSGASAQTVGEIGQARNQLEALVAAGPALGKRFEMERDAIEFDQWAKIQDINLKKRAIENSIRQRAEEALRLQQVEQAELEEQRQSATEKALSIKTLAQEVLSSKGLDAAVGFGIKKRLGRLPLVSPEATEGTARANFEAKAERLSNLLTLDNLKLMSGVLSETDIKILESAGSMLKNFDLTEKEYKEEVRRIIEKADRTLNKQGIDEEQAKFWYGLEDSDIGAVEDIYGDNESSTKAFNPANFY